MAIAAAFSAWQPTLTAALLFSDLP